MINFNQIGRGYILGAGLVGGAVVGAGTAILATQSYYKKKYSKLADEEIQSVKDVYADIPKIVEREDTPEDLEPTPEEREDYINILKDNGYISEETVTVIQTDEARATIRESINYDYNREDVEEDEDEHDSDGDGLLGNRDPNKPYVVSIAEFGNTYTHYSAVTVNYYEADHVLVDENDMPIKDVDGFIGDKTLDMFGQGSGDDKIVYVRNEKIRADIEVIKNEGSYTEEVLGIVEGPNDSVIIRKMRPSD